MGLKSEESSPEKSGEQEKNEENGPELEASGEGQKSKRIEENVPPETTNN